MEKGRISKEHNYTMQINITLGKLVGEHIMTKLLTRQLTYAKMHAQQLQPRLRSAQ